MRPSLSAIALALPLTALGATGAAADPEVEAAIEEQVAAFERAYNEGDTAALAELYTDDAAVFPPGSARVDGRDAIRGVWDGAIAGDLRDLDLTAVEVHAAGDMATEVGTFTATVPAGENRADVRGNYIVLWQRGDDGAWRLHRDIWTMEQ